MGGLPDNRGNPTLCQPVDQPVRVIRPVCKKSIRINVFQHRFRLSDIGILSRCEGEFHRVAESVADGMDLCGQSTPGSSDGLIRSPFLRAPALC